MSQGYVIKYGIRVPPLLDANNRPVAEQPDWLIEKNICLNYESLNEKFPGKLMPRWEHFKLFVSHIWGEDNERFVWQWNPNAEKILQRYHEHKYLSVAGHKSSGKTETMAMIGVAEFLIDPKNTKVIATSTTGKHAQGKIWGSISNIWNAAVVFYERWNVAFEKRGIANSVFIPGVLVPSEKVIRMKDERFVDLKRGIELVAPEQGKEKEAAENIQGYKASKLILMADELATLPMSILTTAIENFSANKDFKMCGGHNPSSYYGPDGVMSRPKDGWSSITEDDDEWETCIEPDMVKGWCLRFDGERSPNVVLGREVWKGLLTVEGLASERMKEGGNKTKSYYKMIKGFWTSTGDLDSIYSETDIVMYGADRKVSTWLDQPTFICGLDPAHSHNGDKAVLVIAKVGTARNPLNGKDQTVFERVETCVLDNDITDKTIDKNEWIVKLTKKKMEQYSIATSGLSLDSTGGGAAFASLLRRDIGTGFLDIIFNSSPSDMLFSSADKRTGKERFVNMMSEIWFVGKELIRSGQVRGLDPDTVREMTSRTYEEKNGKVQVEPKVKMKLRTKSSPDRSDALFCCLHLARLRFGLRSTEKAAPRHKAPTAPSDKLEQIWNPKPRRANFHDLAESVGGWVGAGWGDGGL